MLKKADFVISYVKNQFGGSAQFVEKAKKQGKTIIDLYKR